jgi:polysaccharide export outer membrane protein
LGAAQIRVVDLNDGVARQVAASRRATNFAEALGDGLPVGSIIGKGDALDIAIWEAPPATLFGSIGGDPRLTSSSSTARGTSLPEQMVNNEGGVYIPFAGFIPAAGRTPQQIERDIVARLIGKAHEPQVIVRVVRNSTSNVTVVGDVANSARVPLTPKGERLLDILASAGGVKQPVDKVTIQITRGDRVASLPLGTVIRDPKQNIRLQSDDVVTALFQPYSFTALGATGRSDEVSFEGTGITLAQALGRIAGLQDQRADAKGLFIFRLEDPNALAPINQCNGNATVNGKVPVIYRVNLKDPATFFVAQNFPVLDKDVLYVSNAPLADIQKFTALVTSSVLPVASTAILLNQN